MKLLYQYDDIADLLDTNMVEFIGNKEILKFNNVASLNNRDKYSLDWSRKTVDIMKYVEKSVCNAFVISKEASKHIVPSPERFFIIVESPPGFISELTEKLFSFDDFIEHNTTTSPNIHPSAQIGDNTMIGPNTIIDECIIGNNCKIYGNNFIYKNTVIGNNTTILPGAIIGGRGFGFFLKNNRQRRFAHIGKVVIGNDVEIGSNTCIDRGALGDTRIADGTKIDSMVHIGHNVSIGKDSIICSNTIISGSVEIGNRVWIAPNCAIKEHIKVGDDVFIGIGSVIVENIRNNKSVAGNFAIDKDKFLKHFVKMKGIR